MILYLPYVISLLLGYFFIKKILPIHSKNSFLLHAFLAAGLGLGISSVITFISLISFNLYHKNFIIFGHAILGAILLFFYIKKYHSTFKKPDIKSFKCLFPLVFLIIISIPLWYQCHFYSYGGWDAWSTWNLKAKIIFLGGSDWRNIFDPLIWRSSPHYPLLLPLTNAWGWITQTESVYKIPVFTTYIFTFLTIGLLFFGLNHLIKSKVTFLSALVLMTQPYFIKMALSQYCDMVVAYYLLAALICLIIAKVEDNTAYSLLCGIFLGLLSFSKNEGMAAAVFIAALSVIHFYWRHSSPNKFKHVCYLFTALALSFIPTIVFNFFYAPDNQTFINGLVSPARPVHFSRLKIIFSFYILELGAPFWNIYELITKGQLGEVVSKWHGLWIILMAAFIFNFKKCINKNTLIIPVFLFLYGLIITTYYFINTYFKVDWWLQVSLSRILSALLPTFIFWIIYSLWQENLDSK